MVAEAATWRGARTRTVRPRRTLRGLLLALALGVLAASGAQASAGDPLSVQVAVPDQGAASRRAAEREAFETVLERLAGGAEVLDLDVVRAALATPQRFYSSSSYARRPPGAPGIGVAAPDGAPRPWWLKLTFDRGSVLALLDGAGVPVWTGRRPDLLIWIARETEAGAPELVGADGELGHALLDQADRLGLPVQLPLLDLDDVSRLSARDVWARFQGPIEQASARYPHEALVTLRLYSDAVGHWRADWEGELAGERIDGAADVDTPADGGRRMLDAIARQLAARFAVQAGSGEGDAVWLQVDGIDAIGRYADLMRYLDGLHGVDAVQLVQVRDASLLLRVDASGAGDRLLDVLRVDDRLIPAQQPESAGGIPVWRARWRG